MSRRQLRTVIVGGGAAGFFLAVNLKEMMPTMSVTIIERSQHVLRKVAVSGGGRCNCTNTFSNVSDLQQVYPRGYRLLKRLFKQFDQRSAYEWFERHGVRLAIQDDGCVFPASQDAKTVIGCLTSEARRHGVEVRTGVYAASVEELMGSYDFVCITTGGSPHREGLEWLAAAGHDIVQPVPSLFTLSIADEGLHRLMGSVVDRATVGVAATKLRADGALLVTHWGLSGPAVLRLSSYGARYMSELHYKVPLLVNWTGLGDADVAAGLQSIRLAHGQQLVSSQRPFGLSSRLWDYLLSRTLGQHASYRWQELSRKAMNRLVNTLVADSYVTSGRAPFRDEFVTCGGVSLSSVHPSTLESRRVPHLFFAGEVLDIDGVTGGFNFQAAWTTAYAVASAIARYDSSSSV